MFLHDAVREMLLLGDTTIKASDLRKVLSQLKCKVAGSSRYHQQFAVSEKTCRAPCSVFHADEHMHADYWNQVSLQKIDQCTVILYRL